MNLIAQDIADTDLYTFSVGQMVYNQFPHAQVQYSYKNRAKDKTYRSSFASELKEQVEMMADLRLNSHMRKFLKEKTPWIKPTYMEWLSNSFRFNPSQVNISQDNNNELSIDITGPWYETIFWEVPLLFIITELSRTNPETGNMLEKSPDWDAKIKDKAQALSAAGVNFMDFGTRRRFSFEVQDKVCDTMKAYKPFFKGTSNPYLAAKHNITVNGTNSHQMTMGMQAVYGIQQCNVKAMEHWVKEYHGELGIALTDTITTKKFFEVFDSYYARLFDGVRQDSGDPFEQGEAIIKHYEKLKIDPTTKTIIFSDSLNPHKAINLHNHFKGRVRTLFGIGTNFSSDCGYEPSNHVIKPIKFDFGGGWTDVIKLSDDIGKVTGNSQLVEDALRILKIK